MSTEGNQGGDSLPPMPIEDTEGRKPTFDPDSDPTEALDDSGDDGAGAPPATEPAQTEPPEPAADPQAQRPAGIPKARFDEVNEERKALRDENAELRAMLREHLRAAGGGQTAPAAEDDAPVVRDFAAERKALRAKYDAGEITDEEFDAQRDALLVEQARTEALAEVQPQLKPLAERTARDEQAKLIEALNTEAGKWYAKFPELNHEAESANSEAIAAVVESRDAFIAAGIPPVRALRLAVLEYAESATAAAQPPAAPDKAQAIGDARRASAATAAAAAAAVPPLPAGGTGNRATAGQVDVMNLSREDWEKLPQAEKDRLLEAE